MTETAILLAREQFRAKEDWFMAACCEVAVFGRPDDGDLELVSAEQENRLLQMTQQEAGQAVADALKV